MVVGMQHQQQQPYASPATVLEDASTPCAQSPQSPAAMPSALPKERQERASVDECSSTTSNVPCEPLAPDISRMKTAILNGCDEDVDEGGKEPVPSRGRVKLRDVNEHLICFLCDGYFVDATSITECLHTFCRSCIILHLATKNHCPKCEVEINNSKPHLSLKPDKTLQDIVYKLVPGLFHAEMKRRNRFYLDKPDRDTHLHPEFRGISVDRLVYSPHDTICLSLEYYDNSKEKEDWENVGAHRGSFKPTALSEVKMVQEMKDGDYSVGKSIKHFKCPAAVRIMHLKKLIQLKYCVDTKHKVELFHRRESLPDDYSLMDIAYIYAWKRNSPLKLYYRISLPENDSELLQRRLLLASILEEKSSHSTVVAPSTDGIDETKMKLSPSGLWHVKSPPKIPKRKTETEFSPLSEISDNNETFETKTVLEKDASLDLPAISEPSSREVTKYSGNHDSKVSSVSTTPAVTLPLSKPKVSLTTTAIHTAPKVSSKLKYYSDVKKQPKSIKISVPNPNQMTTPEKPSSNAIRSYLTISSILNEPEPKKPALAKASRCSTVVKDCSNDVKTVPVTAEFSQPKTESTVPVNGSVEPPVALPITSLSASSPSITPAVTSPSVLTNKPKCSKSLLSPAKQLPPSISSGECVASNSEITASIPVKPVIIPPVPASSTVLNSSKTRVCASTEPECTKLTNTKSPVCSETNMTTTNTSSITTSTGSNVCTKTIPYSGLMEKSPQDHASENTTSTVSKTTVTNSTISIPVMKVASSVVPSSTSSVPPPLITLKPSPISKPSLPPLKPRPVQPPFVLTNTKIPSSLEISLTQPKDDRAANNSPVHSLQKMVTKNFVANNVDTVAKFAIKRPFVDVDEPPRISISKAPCTSDEKKKLGVHEITLTTNDSAPAKKIFSPNILPEVSITLNPHPDQPSKRITPETSFDVTCFKPAEKLDAATNGIPPLTPITKYPAGSSPICKNIQNSPIKNLNTKSLKNPQRNSFSPKNRPKPLLVCDTEPKMRKVNGAGIELAKHVVENNCATVEAPVNGIALPLKSPESVPVLSKPQVDRRPRNEKTGTAVSSLSGAKKEGSRHQSIPQLIDITTPRYTQLMAAAAQNAKMRSMQNSTNNLNSALHIKLPSADESAAASTGAALDLSSPSSCEKDGLTVPAVDQLSESPPDKKKLIQSMPPLMIPVSMSGRSDSKVSPSGQSLTKIERRVSPIAKILDRKSDVSMTPIKGCASGSSMGKRHNSGGASDSPRSIPFPANGRSPQISPSSRTSKTPPSNADVRRISPSNGSNLLSAVSPSKSPLAPSPPFMGMPGAANYHATILHLMQMQQMQQLQQNWLSKVRDPVPPHPLMFDHSKPSTSQESLLNFKK